MIKVYCDMCKKETENEVVGNRTIFELGDFKVECMVCKDNTWNGGHLCFDCLKKILNSEKYYSKDTRSYPKETRRK